MPERIGVMLGITWRDVMMLNYVRPDDSVLGTGELHTVREFAEEAFKAVGLIYIGKMRDLRK